VASAEGGTQFNRNGDLKGPIFFSARDREVVDDYRVIPT